MKTRNVILAVVMTAVPVLVNAADTTPIRYNQIGYLPQQEKVIVVEGAQPKKVVVYDAARKKKVLKAKVVRSATSPFTGKTR